MLFLDEDSLQLLCLVNLCDDAEWRRGIEWFATMLQWEPSLWRCRDAGCRVCHPA
jgi:hypothetical protein